jgi:hypothetical protein
MADEEIRLRNYELSIRDWAPIAAEFEECTQLFQLLCSAFEANPRHWKSYLVVLAGDRDVLASWGAETGATSYVLDHALRKNAELQEHALQLLRDLSSELQKSECFQRFLADGALHCAPEQMQAALQCELTLERQFWTLSK